MKTGLYVLMICIIFISTHSKNKIIYHDPVAGAKLVNIHNNVILGFEKLVTIEEDTLKNNITVSGSTGKIYSGSIKFSGGNRIIFIPECPFAPGEKVTVSLSGALAVQINSGKIFSFLFETSRIKPVQFSGGTIINEMEPFLKSSENPLVTTPPPLPAMNVTTNTNPEDGFLFLSNFGVVIQYTPHLIITTKNAVPYAYMQLPANGLDFKKQPNGNLTYYSSLKRKFYELRPDFSLLDSFYCGNGYSTDEHELLHLLNGHTLLMCYDVQVVNMSQYVTGGDTAASVTGLVLQELDENKNVIFQWRSWDHFLVTDAWHENLTAHEIDYVHCNAIDVDNDDNLLISSRHMDEITKINRTTGDIIWRFGGKNNQFTVLNDSLQFNYQHAVRRISNGNITIYDNGVFRFPPFSRAVEYSLDEQNKTAARVWEYRNTPSTFGMAMGYVQRLPGGNTLISWGSTTPTVTEVTPTGIKVFEMSMVSYMYSYRVFKFPWNGSPTVINNENNRVPSEFSLEQNYPNPFNPVTHFRYRIAKTGFVSVAVFDILGRKVETLVNGPLNAGTYEAEWNASGYSSGIYYYKLVSGDFSETRKMILLK